MRFGASCGQLGSYVVLVGESAEDLFAVDPVLGEVDRLGWASRSPGSQDPVIEPHTIG